MLFKNLNAGKQNGIKCIEVGYGGKGYVYWVEFKQAMAILAGLLFQRRSVFWC